MVANLKEIVDRLDCLMDGWRYFYNKKTGEILEFEMEYMRIAEEYDEEEETELRDWERESVMEIVKAFENWENIIELPTKYDIDEYEIMSDFADEYENPRISNKLQLTLGGRGAFRRFKDAVNNLGVADEWYKYKESKLTKIAKLWCEDNQIEYK